MIRLLLHLLNKPNFESCKSCETLKQQLALSNTEKKEITETLLSLIQPKVLHAPTVHIPEQSKAVNTFTQRRNLLEKAHAVRKETREQSPFIAKVEENKVTSTAPVTAESIDAMEKKLDLGEEDASKIG